MNDPIRRLIVNKLHELSLEDLRELEWSDRAVDGSGMAMHLQGSGPIRPCCPLCGGFELDGHQAGCLLEEAIEKRAVDQHDRSLSVLLREHLSRAVMATPPLKDAPDVISAAVKSLHRDLIALAKSET